MNKTNAKSYDHTSYCKGAKQSGRAAMKRTDDVYASLDQIADPFFPPFAIRENYDKLPVNFIRMPCWKLLMVLKISVSVTRSILVRRLISM